MLVLLACVLLLSLFSIGDTVSVSVSDSVIVSVIVIVIVCAIC